MAWVNKKELTRDILALGSIPFFFIVMIRASLGIDRAFVIQLLFAALVIFILTKILVDANLYVARALVLFTFSSLYYESKTFTVFAFLLLVAIFASAKYKKATVMQLVRGAIIGVVASFIAYYGEPFVSAVL